jgi:foldase protein PrsA
LKKLFLLLAAFALALAACGGGSAEVAATVDATSDVTVGFVNGLMDNGEDATVSKQQFADFLGFAIQWIVIEDSAMEEYDVSFTDEEIEAEADLIFTTNAEPDVSREDFLAANQVTNEFLLNVAHQQLIDRDVRVVLEDDLPRPAQEDIDAQMDASVVALTEVCARHILVETEEEAADVEDRLGAGESFEGIATELSLDTGSGANGGDLGCSSPAQYVPEFQEATLVAEIDEVTEPVQTEFGYHVILVYDRTEPAAEDLPTEDDIIDTINITALGQAVNDWFLGVLAEATVEVNEKYGTWQTEPTPGVVAPAE